MSGALLHPNESLAQRFAKTAAAFPDNNALFINGVYHSYSALLELAQKICSDIPQDPRYRRIGIVCNSDVYTYASILAVNLYGAAYVPLNAAFPPVRNQGIIRQCGLELILNSGENEWTGLHADEMDAQTECYILFTSGSTGEPKGVPVPAENVRHFFNYFLREYDFSEKDKFLQVYELSFDVSVFSFFMPLLLGACCYVLPEEGIKPVKIIDWLKKYEISVLSMVPGVLKYLEQYLPEIQLPALRYSFFSGDALLHALAVKWKRCIPNAALHNFYGPTETTIVCTRYVFDEVASSAESINGIVPLGTAFPGMEFILVDEKGESVEKGELCFSGTQVIAGYLDKNESRFFGFRGKRYYKTGDLASVNENGNLIFHGRNDAQVKINGYRVELGETEHAIRNATGKDCAVFYKENKLVAFVETAAINEQQLREELCQTLPEYMIPKRFVTVEKFGLNANGKVDRNALINAYL